MKKFVWLIEATLLFFVCTAHAQISTQAATGVHEAASPIPETPKPMPLDAKPVFDVLTIKPSNPDRRGQIFSMNGRHISSFNTTVNDLITMAYDLHVREIMNAPDWFSTDKFDVDGIPDVEGQPNNAQFKLLFQNALTQRFGLVFHHEDRELSAYVLIVGKGGPKMQVTADKPGDPKNFKFHRPGQLSVTNSTMQDFCNRMQSTGMSRPVIDRTGLTDRYDFQLNWTPEESQFGSASIHVPTPNPDDTSAPPGLFTALQEQLGLKMEAAKTTVSAMVIDKSEKPGAN